MVFSGSPLLRVVVLDDDAVVRHWLGQRLGQEYDLSLTGSCAFRQELFEALSSSSIDVAVIDFPLGPSEARLSRNVNIIGSQKQVAFRKLDIRTDSDLSNIRHQLERA